MSVQFDLQADIDADIEANRDWYAAIAAVEVTIDE